MNACRRLAGGVLAGAALVLLAATASAFELPASCGKPAAAAAAATPLPVLRKRLEAIAETDPAAAVRLMCDTIPRVARSQGERSTELAWWAASLATPLIAYMDKFNEAIPLLQFAQPILERRRGRYAAELADIHVAYAWIAFRQGRLADSAAAWERPDSGGDRKSGPAGLDRFCGFQQAEADYVRQYLPPELRCLCAHAVHSVRA